MIFLHCSDFRLDMPQSVDALYDAARLDGDTAARENTIRSVLRYAEKNKIPLLLLTGNLFANGFVGDAALSFLCDTFAAYPACRIVIVPGTYDFYADGSPYQTVRFPDNVTVVTSGTPTVLSFDDLGCALVAFAQTDRGNPEPLKTRMAGVALPAVSAHIRILAGACPVTEISPTAQETAPFAYAALGNAGGEAEAFAVRRGNTVCAGTDGKTACLVRITEEGDGSVHTALRRLRFSQSEEPLTLDVSDCRNSGDYQTALSALLGENTPRGNGVPRVRCTGTARKTLPPFPMIPTDTAVHITDETTLPDTVLPAPEGTALAARTERFFSVRLGNTPPEDTEKKASLYLGLRYALYGIGGGRETVRALVNALGERKSRASRTEERRHALEMRINASETVQNLSAHDAEQLRMAEERIRQNEARTLLRTEQLDKYKEYVRLSDAENTIVSLSAEADRAEARADALRRSVSGGGVMPDTAFADTLDRIADTVADAEKECRALEDERREAGLLDKKDDAALTDERILRVQDDGGIAMLRNRYEFLEKKSKLHTVIGCIFLFFTVVFGAFLTALLVIHALGYLSVLILCILCGIGAGVFLYARSRYEKKRTALLRRYGCEDADSLEPFFDDYRKNRKEALEENEKASALEQQYTAAAERYRRACADANTQLARLMGKAMADNPEQHSLPPEAIREAAARLRATFAEIETLTAAAASVKDRKKQVYDTVGYAELASIRKQRELLRAYFDGKTPDAIDTEPILRELDFNMKSTASLRDLTERLRRTAAGNTTGEDVRILKPLYAELVWMLAEERRHITALTLALTAIKNASESRKRENP